MNVFKKCKIWRNQVWKKNQSENSHCWTYIIIDANALKQVNKADKTNANLIDIQIWKNWSLKSLSFENSNIETSYCEALILVTLVIEMQKMLKSIKLMKLSYIYGHVWTSKCWHINFWNPIFKDKLFVLKNVIYSCVNELKKQWSY